MLNTECDEEIIDLRQQTEVCDLAKRLIRAGEVSENDIAEVAKHIVDDGWQIIFSKDENDNVGKFSRKNGQKTITLCRLDDKAKIVSFRHLLLALVHEYLIGSMTENAAKTADPHRYIRQHFQKYALLDLGVASVVDEGGATTMTGFITTHHRKNILRMQLTTVGIDGLLTK